MSVEPAVNRGTVCLSCSAVGDPGATACWMCGSTNLRKPGPAASTGSISPLDKKEDVWHLGDDLAQPKHTGFSIVKPIVAIVGGFLGLAFLVGMWKESPGLAVLVALVIGGVILGTVRHDKGLDGQPREAGGSAAASIVRVFAGIAATFAMIAIVFVVGTLAVVGYLLITCLGMLNK
jgi:ribosomal protein L40E